MHPNLFIAGAYDTIIVRRGASKKTRNTATESKILDAARYLARLYLSSSSTSSYPTRILRLSISALET